MNPFKPITPRFFRRDPLPASPWRGVLRVTGVASIGLILIAVAAPVLLTVWCVYAFGLAAAWMVAVFWEEMR